MSYYGYVILKVMLGFVIVIAHMNLSGKTQLSQMTPVDFIGNFVLGGIIGGVIYNETIPLKQYITLLLLGVAFISILNFISKHVQLLRSVTIGEPIVLIQSGQFVMDNIKEQGNKIDIENVISCLHAKGVQSLQQVHYAQIEPSGQLTVTQDKEPLPSVILMHNGTVRQGGLNKIKKDEAWLMQALAHEGIVEPESVFLAEFWEGRLHFILQDGRISGP